MLVFANLLFALSLVLILVQLVFVFRYARKMDCRLGQKPDRSFQPEVTVVLCMRGVDPSLGACLDALLSQVYRQYRLLCVVDSDNDPAANLIRRRNDDRLRLMIAPPQNDSCSLKCNSLVSAIETIEDSIVVLVDADTVPDEHWLADLVAPLKKKGVVASSGSRWFLPIDGRIGSYIRYLWNLAAVPQMDAYKVAWGGSLALEARFLKESGLLDSWSRSLFEDTSVSHYVQEFGGQMEMLPGLLVPNQESISMPSALRWMTRQILDTRLYHRCFPLIALHSFSVVAFGVVWLVAMGIAVAGANWSSSVDAVATRDDGLPLLILAMVAVNFLAFYLCSWLILDKCGRDALKRRGHQVSKRKWFRIRPFVAVIATQLVYCLATIRAIATRKVTWRGITYLIRGPQRILRTNYCGIESVVNSSRDSNQSI